MKRILKLKALFDPRKEGSAPWDHRVTKIYYVSQHQIDHIYFPTSRCMRRIKRYLLVRTYILN